MDSREVKERIKKGWLRAALIIEVLGKPADYIVGSLNLAVEALEKNKKAEVLAKKIHPATLVKDTKEVYTTFAEVEILVPEMSKLVEIIFDYMPSSIEILEPTSFSLKLEDANAVLNDLIGRIHQYDAVLKKMRLELGILAQRLRELENIKSEKSETKTEEKKESREEKSEKRKGKKKQK